MMAENANIAPAGGLEDGSMGTSFERIKSAIESVYLEDGVLVLMDMGSAVMTTEMVLEDLEGKSGNGRLSAGGRRGCRRLRSGRQYVHGRNQGGPCGCGRNA